MTSWSDRRDARRRNMAHPPEPAWLQAATVIVGGLLWVGAFYLLYLFLAMLGGLVPA